MSVEQLTLDLKPAYGFADAQEETRACVCGAALSVADVRHGRTGCATCRGRRALDLAAERDQAAGLPLKRRRCDCARPLLVYDPELRQARDLLCGRAP